MLTLNVGHDIDDTYHLRSVGTRLGRERHPLAGEQGVGQNNPRLKSAVVRSFGTIG